MELARIRDYATAKIVSRGLKWHNRVFVSPRRILSTPHYAIRLDNCLAGWIGYRRQTHRKYEINHLSILPDFRREGLAEEATLRMIGIVWTLGCRIAVVRIRRGNRASVLLAKGLGFSRISGGAIEVYSLKVRNWPVLSLDQSTEGQERVRSVGKVDSLLRL